MKKNYYLLLLAAATSFSVHAQTGNTFPEFKTGIATKQQALETQKVSPNADKEKGLIMYATTLEDYFNQERGWYTFRSNEPGNATKLKTWNPGSQSNIDGLRCGCWGGDAYYAYYILQYPLGLDYPHAFMKVDVKTGELETIKAFNTGDDFKDNWRNYMIYCMTYNPVKDVIYALGQTTKSDKTQVSSLYQIDKTNGTPTKLHDFDFISFAMSVDMEGTLWVQNSIYENSQNVGTKLTAFNTDNFNVIKEVNLTYDESTFKTAYYGTMSFDYTTGDLYWIALATNMNNQSLYTVDLETGKMKSLGVFWGDFVGLYIPYILPENENVPAKVIDLNATPDMTGAMKSTLSWTNPSLKWNKETLTNLKEVKIYKKGSETPAATLSATGKEGQKMSWVDEKASAGINTYYVVPCNDNGNGVKDSINVFIGEDAPGPVTNITIENNTESVTLKWDAPTIGMNEGYVNPNGLKYTIVRYPGAMEVAKDIAERTFTDSDFSGQQCFYYTIQAKNDNGVGEITESERFVAGTAHVAPVEFNFSDELYAGAWTNLGDWTWSKGVQTGDERMTTSSRERENNFLISPDIKLEAGKTYKFKTTIRTDIAPNGCSYDFKFTLGKGKTVADQTITLRDEKAYTTDTYYYTEVFEDVVEISETATYNFGIDVYTITGGDTFSFIGVSIEEVYDIDMSATELKGLSDAVCGAKNTCTVVLYNNASTTAENYKVKIARVANDEYVVLGETTEVPAVKSFESAEVTVTYTPDVEDNVDIVGIVEIEGDKNEGNNMTQPYTILVLPEGMVPFNVIITDESSLGEYTRVPMSFAVEESMSQSIYLASEIKMETNGKIQRVAYEYSGNDITSILGPFNVKLYMCNTDKETYADETEGIAIEDMTLVYEGETVINPGENNVMTFILSQEFDYNKDKNLCVAMVKTGLVGNTYPARFKVFNSNKFDITRTILQDGSAIATWNVPVLQLAIKSVGSGIENVSVGAPAVWYDSLSSTLNFKDANVKEVYVYDISGKMINLFNLNGTETSLSLNLSAGLYIIQAVNVDGSVNNVKINVVK